METDLPAYLPAALFQCVEGCGTFRRDRCGTHRGTLHCPRCRYVGTLRFTGKTDDMKEVCSDRC
jgi:hypothetical protein